MKKKEKPPFQLVEKIFKKLKKKKTEGNAIAL